MTLEEKRQEFLQVSLRTFCILLRCCRAFRIPTILVGSMDRSDGFDACLQVIQPVAFVGGGLCAKHS